jgi:hypothetical protein
MLLYGIDCFEGYSGVSVFEYFDNLLCFMSKKYQCNKFTTILWVDILFGMILVRYSIGFD